MNNYDDIMYIKHFNPKYHKRMSNGLRAAQFASFNALEGFTDVIKFKGKTKEKRIILSDDMKNNINSKLQEIENNINNKPLIKVKYYNKDKYIEYMDYIKKIDIINKELVYNNKKIKLYDIIELNFT